MIQLTPMVYTDVIFLIADMYTCPCIRNQLKATDRSSPDEVLYMHEAIRHFICVKLYYWDQTDFVTMKMNNYYSYVTVGARTNKIVECHSSQTKPKAAVSFVTFIETTISIWIECTNRFFVSFLRCLIFTYKLSRSRNKICICVYPHRYMFALCCTKLYFIN